MKTAITMGDPSGIGVEIIIKSLNEINTDDFVLIGNREIFGKAEKLLNISLPKIKFINIDYDTEKIQPGVESRFSGELSYLCLKKACELAKNKQIKAIITAPVSKNALNLAGYNYSGQTEILGEELSTHKNQAQMLFVAGNFKILLLTRHIPLKEVPQAVTKENIIETVKILNNELKNKFNIQNPKIAMCALNPHAGENGLIGDEEITQIIPAIKELNLEGVDIEGPFGADVILPKGFLNQTNYDCYIACYHDQGLTCIKSLGADNVLNVTIGLDILRVSPSHGTAFDIAYQNIASHKSMLNALKLVEEV
ncbi:MAG: 4-hydroxythreonine-4-phosphate dehydrogenase PdxA [Candidatus Gastranaerophilales bacterium]|nr:4-hydroxythreonine-4-phosphate dehydrogenase PdxA [Candidatus Gastranaerophilales bacterium]